jgi:hypothetical protein
VRRQSEAATALWIYEDHQIQSGVALRLPPHSKKIAFVFKDGIEIARSPPPRPKNFQ